MELEQPPFRWFMKGSNAEHEPPPEGMQRERTAGPLAKHFVLHNEDLSEVRTAGRVFDGLYYNMSSVLELS